MTRIFVFTVILLLLNGVKILPVAQAQTVSVISLVNGEPITTLDLEQRLRFLSFSTGQNITEQNKAQFERDALQILVDEKLKFQAARKIDEAIVASARSNARQLVDQTYEREGQNASKLLKANNVSFQVALDKAASDLAWVTVLQSTFPKQFESVERLTDSELERLKNSVSDPQVRLMEIVLLPSNDRPLVATLELGNQIVEAIRNGTDFRGIAQQYSVASSAKNGGDIGWAQVKRLPVPFIDPLDASEIGAVLDPIVLDGIVYILQKQGYRPEGLLDSSLFRVSMARAVLPVSDPTNTDIVEAARKELMQQTGNINSCSDMRELNEKLGSGAESDLANLTIGELAPQLASIILPLELQEKTKPILFAEGFSVIMLCEKIQPEVTLPSREEIERGELDKLFSVLSSRYLIRLRRSAVIEKRG